MVIERCVEAGSTLVAILGERSFPHASNSGVRTTLFHHWQRGAVSFDDLYYWEVMVEE